MPSCGKAFAYKSPMKEHHDCVHLGLKRESCRPNWTNNAAYPCPDEAGTMTFATKSRSREHEDTHLKIWRKYFFLLTWRPGHSCLECPSAFYNAAQLDSHRKSAHRKAKDEGKICPANMRSAGP